jgi:hypothetical protein
MTQAVLKDETAIEGQTRNVAPTLVTPAAMELLNADNADTASTDGRR